MIAQYWIVFNHSNELIVKSFWDTGLKYWNTNIVCTFEYCILDVLYSVVYFTLSMCSIRTRTFTTVRRHLKAQAQASMFCWLAPVPPLSASVSASASRSSTRARWKRFCSQCMCNVASCPPSSTSSRSSSPPASPTSSCVNITSYTCSNSSKLWRFAILVVLLKQLLEIETGALFVLNLIITFE